MLNEVINIIAKEISARHQIISSTENSVFSVLESNPQELKNIIGPLATKINNELILVKNKLRPLMIDIANDIETKLSEVQSQSDILKYKIVTVNYPSVLDELSELRLIHPRRDPLDIGVSNVSIPVPPVETIKNYFKHENSSINTFLNSIIVDLKEDGLVQLWDKYLTSVSNTNVNISSLGLNVQDKINELLLLHTALTNLIKEYDGSNDNHTTEILRLFQSEVGNYLTIAKEVILQNRQTNKLIVSVKDGTVAVDEFLYNKYIEEGHTPEALLGIAVKGKLDIADSLYNSIVEKEQEYVSIWSAKIKLESFAEANNAVSRTKVVYDIILRNLFVPEISIPKDLLEYLEVSYQDAKANLDKILDTESTSNILDYNYMARRIVGDVLFPNTNFSIFSSHIIEYCKLNQDITPQDAATFASLDFILDFLLVQVKVGDYDGLSRS